MRGSAKRTFVTGLSILAVGIVPAPASAAMPAAGTLETIEIVSEGLDIHSDDPRAEVIENLPDEAAGVPLVDGDLAARASVHPLCGGKTDNPHNSWPNASVHGRTKCDTGPSIAWLWVETSLYRVDWWGDNHMATDESSRNNSRSSQDAHPHSSCDNAPSRTYRGVSAHQFIDQGVRYGAATANVGTFACTP